MQEGQPNFHSCIQISVTSMVFDSNSEQFGNEITIDCPFVMKNMFFLYTKCLCCNLCSYLAKLCQVYACIFQMAKSIRSKWKRKMRSVRREKFGKRELERLKDMIQKAEVTNVEMKEIGNGMLLEMVLFQIVTLKVLIFSYMLAKGQKSLCIGAVYPSSLCKQLLVKAKYKQGPLLNRPTP